MKKKINLLIINLLQTCDTLEDYQQLGWEKKQQGEQPFHQPYGLQKKVEF